MTLKAVWFCGARSPYGRAHLLPLVRSRFTVVAIVIPSTARWRQFEQRSRWGGRLGRWPRLRSLWHQGWSAGVAARDLLRRRDNRTHKDAASIQALLLGSTPPLWRVFDVNDVQFLQRLKVIGADLHFSTAYPQIFSRALLDIPRRGSVNFHPSPLPRYRGGHPHLWGLINGETTWAVTAHYMTEAVDAGDIIAQRTFPIQDLDYDQVYARMIEETPPLVSMAEAFFHDGIGRAIPQDSTQATRFRNDAEWHTRILWHQHSAEHIKNLGRTQQAVCYFRRRKITPLKIQPVDVESYPPEATGEGVGTIVGLRDGCVVIRVTNGYVAVQEVMVSGQRLPSRDWMEAWGVSRGERFS